MSKKDFIKITIQDIEIAEDFFENDKHLSEFLVNVIRYYRGEKNYFKSKIVTKYFKTYRKTMDFIIEAKLKGKLGADIKAENERVRKQTLEGVLIESLQGKSKEERVKSKEESKNEKTEQLDWSKLLNKFNSITGKKSRVVPSNVKKAILARLKEGYTKADIITGIENCYKDSHHQETNHKYLTLEFISRPDKLEKFVNVTPLAQKKAPQYKDDWR